MFQIKAKLLYNKRIAANYLHCAFYAPVIAKKAQPGQFVNIKVAQAAGPLLRRPFSIHRVNGPGIELIYEALGKGTQILSQKTAGEYLDIIGPLGNGFILPAGRRQAGAIRHPLLVAGGIGVAPLLFLARKLIGYKLKPITVLIGAKTKSYLLCEKQFKQLGCKVKVSTDDGSKGFKGKVTDLLRYLLSTMDCGLSTIYACGPKPMLRAVSELANRGNVPAQLSLEAHMACGFGACLGCTINTIEGYKRVCKDGPVFGAEQIYWA